MKVISFILIAIRGYFFICNIIEWKEANQYAFGRGHAVTKVKSISIRRLRKRLRMPAEKIRDKNGNGFAVNVWTNAIKIIQ